jgi:cytochrome c553
MTPNAAGWKHALIKGTAATLPLLAISFARAADDPKPSAEAIEFFESKIRPILAGECVTCHGPEKQKAGLRLDSRPAMMEGGSAGPVVKPGDPESSRIVEVVRYNSDVQMPPKKKLSDAEISALVQWVRTGAVWPEATKGRAPAGAAGSTFKLTADDRAYWAFQPIKSPPLPKVRDGEWPRTAIDRFALSKWEEKGLRASAPADKRTLIRRATFDLTGLPPTIEEVHAFLSDSSANAFDRVIDRLLASPHYGERWGRHWLDVARYGEDQAHTFEARLYPYGYRYRDWVVSALNEDMPYDRFLTEQIAGDLIDGPGRDDRLAATGLFSLGPVYYGRAIYDELDDRVDTLSRGVLGLTVACARCHDHKFDPISQRDYYALAGIFNSTKYQEYPKATPEQTDRYEKGQAAIKSKNDEITAYLRDEGLRLSESLASKSAQYIETAWVLFNRRKADPKLAAGEIAKAAGLDAATIERWIKYLFADEAKKRPQLAQWGKLIEKQDVSRDLSADEIAIAEVRETARNFQAYLDATIKLRDAIKQHSVAASASGQTGAKPLALSDADSELLRDTVAANGLYTVAGRELESRLPAESKTALKVKRADLDRLKKAAPAKPPFIHALADAASPANMKVFLRGNPQTPGEESPRRLVEVISAPDTPVFARGSGRLELARAIASPDNPLTARVIVNRVWAQHFGRGLVATPSNFGHMGERPSNPELLDHLASWFIASGWSLKALHREILRSKTYQLASENVEANRAIDSENAFYWRANRRRLEVEAWRDATLAVTGELDTTLGGPSFDLKSSDSRRRTFYAAVSRHNLDGLLRLFDFPDPNLTSDRRVVTTVPLQQLFVLNSPFMERRAKALAARLTADSQESAESRINHAFWLLFGRPASPREFEVSRAFLDDAANPSAQDAALSRWEQWAQALLGTNEFAFVD